MSPDWSHSPDDAFLRSSKDALTCCSRRTGVNNYINDGLIPFSCFGLGFLVFLHAAPLSWLIRTLVTPVLFLFLKWMWSLPSSDWTKWHFLLMLNLVEPLFLTGDTKHCKLHSFVKVMHFCHDNRCIQIWQDWSFDSQKKRGRRTLIYLCRLHTSSCGWWAWLAARCRCKHMKKIWTRDHWKLGTLPSVCKYNVPILEAADKHVCSGH